MNLRRRLKVLILSWVVLLVLVAAAGTVFSFCQSRNQNLIYGVTFSHYYAESLGLDWQETYLAVVNDLAVQKIRIPIYWSDVERSTNAYDYSKIDWMMQLAENRNIPVTLVVGAKVPRWPECFYPEWLSYESIETRQSEQLDFLSETVRRYADHPALERWQLENEPFFPFGHCPPPNANLFDAELKIVKTLDDQHPVQITSSGEQSLWLVNGSKADLLGVSLYRVAWNDVVSYWTFPIPPALYRWQRLITRLLVDDIVISELQAEPWMTEETFKWSIDKQYQLFTADDLKKHLDYAQQTGIKEIYLWGVEWWYYLKIHGEDRLWDAGSLIMTQ